MGEPRQCEIDRRAVTRYFFWQQLLLLCMIGLFSFGIGLIAALIYLLALGRWLPRKQADALRYWLDGSTVRIDQGVFFLKRKAIPLDRVTDVALVQGPLMRRLGIWSLHIQTAGVGNPMAEGVLYGLADPEAIRDQLLAARDAARADREPAA